MTSFCFAAARISIILGFVIVAFPSGSSFADSLESVESYSPLADEFSQPKVGAWPKVDSPNSLDNRPDLCFATSSDYSIKSRLKPTSLNNSVDDFEFRYCPDTWIVEEKFSATSGIYQNASFASAGREVGRSVGMYSLGSQNSQEFYYRDEAVNWSSIGLIAESTTWADLSKPADLDFMPFAIGFASTSYSSVGLAGTGSTSNATNTNSNLQTVGGLGDGYFDGYSFTATAAVVPGPYTALLVFLGVGSLATRRRREN